MDGWEIRKSDLTEPEVIALLEFHATEMHETSPPGTAHALNLEGLKQPGIQVWGLWLGDRLAGVAALKQHDEQLAEVKSMRTQAEFLRQGVGARLLGHLIEEARLLGVSEVKLETGTAPEYDAACALYRRLGFASCPPFADYTGIIHNQYFELQL